MLLEYRTLGETGMRVSAISLGTWAFGSEWGTVSDEESYAALNRAIDLGVNFLDTADVYGDGRSEKLIGELLEERSDDEIFVATKAGRRLDPHTAEEFFPLAEERNIGVIARVPLASGLLSGKMTADREFASDDHRNFNREGQAFDRGETFSGVPFEAGLRAAEELKGLVPEGHTLAQLALHWILMHPAVSCAIPGAKRPDQVENNLAAIEIPPLSEDTMDRIREIYERHIRPEVHHLW